MADGAPRRLAQRLCFGLALALSCGGSPPPTDARVPDLPGPPAERRPSWGYRYIPDALTPGSDAEKQTLLERRLAAFALQVERSQKRGPKHAEPVVFDETVGKRLRAVLSKVEEYAQVSVHVRDLDHGVTLFDHFGQTPLIPASNHKILTSSAALDLLGPDYRFETRVVRDGDALVLVGEGDPTLNVSDLRALARDVKAAGGVDGVERIVVDDSAFSAEHLPPGFSEDGPGESYQALSGALSLEFNTVTVTVHTPRTRTRPNVTFHPKSSSVTLVNRARVGKGKIRVTSGRDRAHPHGTVVQIRGAIATGAPPVTVRRRVLDPAQFTGDAFAAILAEVTEHERPFPVEHGLAPTSGGEVVARHASAPLEDIAAAVLAYSNNFMAEQLIRTLGWRLTGTPGDWENGGEVVRRYWEIVAGTDAASLTFENGSGLSRSGRATTAGLVDLISVANRVNGVDGALIDALPVAGEEGTLRARLRQSGKRVRAKTGTLAGVSGLTGAILSEQGEPMVGFSILINVREVGSVAAKVRRKAEDEIVMAVLEQLDRWEARRAIEVLEAAGELEAPASQ